MQVIVHLQPAVLKLL